MPQLDPASYSSQIFWLIVSFFSMFFIMSKIILPKISDILSQRQRKIDGSLSTAFELKKQAEDIIEKYEQAIEQAETRAAEAMQKAQNELKDKIAQKEQELVLHLEKKVKEGEEQIVKLQLDMAKKIDDISLDLADQIANKIGLNEISKDDIKKLGA